uniref:VOC family protein n=1 Tax=uncultured Caulobacter sp. TaxID=158749 RepID=UPI00262991EA
AGMYILEIGTDITQRKQEMEAKIRGEEIIRAQSRAIQELSTPLIPITDDILVMPLVGLMDAGRVAQVMEALLAGLAATRGKRMNPLRTAIHHLNLQAKSLDDVTLGYQRLRKMGYEMANAIGQHPNDRELSFYVVSPSGFEVELGWDPIVVDEAHWVPTTYQGMSLWGHRPENLTLAYRLGRLKQGVTSLMRDEFMPEGVQR